MRGKASFTALDISNALKLDRYPVAHREVAATVREIYASGAMAYFEYERKIIPVITDGGAKRTEAFLYHFAQVRPRTYQTRDQNALPPVPADAARDMTNYTSAGPRPLRPGVIPSQVRPRRNRARRDGALSVPRRLLIQLGWRDGQALSLVAKAGEVSLQPAGDNSAALRVWRGFRLRVCRTKLRAAALSAERVSVTVEGGQMKIVQVKAG